MKLSNLFFLFSWLNFASVRPKSQYMNAMNNKKKKKKEEEEKKKKPLSYAVANQIKF